MATREKRARSLLPWLAIFLAAAAVATHYLTSPWGYYHRVSSQEAALRNQVIAQAQQYLGCREADGSHMEIVDRYNTQPVLPRGYTVTDTDSWCATFVTAVALDCGLLDIIPPECSCEEQIKLFQALGRWEEEDGYLPLPGDIIYYDWQARPLGDCTGWSDHVGIVVGTKWPFIKVIEGNKDDAVGYRILPINAPSIRGYGRPDYAGAAAQQ